jgi:hypothetical protein
MTDPFPSRATIEERRDHAHSELVFDKSHADNLAGVRNFAKRKQNASLVWVQLYPARRRENRLDPAALQLSFL